MSNGQVDELMGRRVNKLYARRDRGMWQVDRITRGQGNMLLVVEDRVTDEQVRGVTERGGGCGRTGSGMGTEREWAGGGREMGGENGRHVRGGVFYLDVNLFCLT
mgnify:CR=1 FL=1